MLVKAGDTIQKDQTVLELETDKATIEVPSSVSGTVQEVKVKPGDKVKVGQVVLTLGDGAAADTPAQKAEPAKADAGGDAPAKGAPAEGGGSKSDTEHAGRGGRRAQAEAAARGGSGGGRAQPGGNPRAHE